MFFNEIHKCHNQRVVDRGEYYPHQILLIHLQIVLFSAVKLYVVWNTETMEQ